GEGGGGGARGGGRGVQRGGACSRAGPDADGGDQVGADHDAPAQHDRQLQAAGLPGQHRGGEGEGEGGHHHGGGELPADQHHGGGGEDRRHGRAQPGAGRLHHRAAQRH